MLSMKNIETLSSITLLAAAINQQLSCVIIETASCLAENEELSAQRAADAVRVSNQLDLIHRALKTLKDA